MDNINVVAENAVRLLSDSELLFENKRYPTTLTTSIMVIEEAGKCVALCDGLSATKLRHRQKQAYIGMFYWQWAIFEVFMEEFKEFSKLLLEDGKVEEYEYLLGLNPEEKIDYMKLLRFGDVPDLPEKVEAYVRENFQYKEKLLMLEDAVNGQLEKKRQSGVYADISQTGDLLNNPYDIQAYEAEEWLEDARVAVEFMKMHVMLSKSKEFS